MYILVAGAGLHGDGLSAHGELLAADVEPAARVGGGAGVVEREHDKLLVQRVGGRAVGSRVGHGDGVECMLAALQLRNGYQLVGLGLLPPAVVESVAHACFKVYAGSVLLVEGHLHVALAEHFFGQCDAEGRLAVAQWQRHLSLVGLAGLVGHVGGEHEVVEHGVAGLGQHHGHVGREHSLVVGHGLALGHGLVVRSGAEDAPAPVARVGHPPVGLAAHHLVLHLGTLYGHAGIAAGRATGHHGVAVFIVLGHAWNVHLEGWPLIFLHAERVRRVVGTQGEHARQSLRGQGEAGCGGAKAVGGDLLLAHHLVIGVAQLHVYRLPFLGLEVAAVVGGVDDGRSMHRLAWAIDGAVSIDVGGEAIAVVVVISEAAPNVHRGAGLVGCGVGP